MGGAVSHHQGESTNIYLVGFIEGSLEGKAGGKGPKDLVFNDSGDD